MSAAIEPLTTRERNWLGDQRQAQIEAKFDRLGESYFTLMEAARALYEQVKMDELTGTCLSNRMASLVLGDLLAGAGDTEVSAAALIRVNGILAKKKVARFEHQCGVCSRTIPKGETYLWVNGYYAVKSCLEHRDA